jgi:predicted alpha/beta-hydrolase family hydrolase
MTTITRHKARGPGRALLVLAHGAGAGQEHPFMVRFATGLAARGIDVATFDFPYMAAGRKAPDRLPALLDSFREAVTAARARPSLWSRPLFVGGKSMGGRVATHVATEAIDGLRGVLALGYPLHPPGRADKPRVEHLQSIRVPMLVVQGERDTFGTPAELRSALKAVRHRVTLHVVRDGDHSLKVRKSSGQDQDAVYEEALDAIAGWIAAHAKTRSRAG